MMRLAPWNDSVLLVAATMLLGVAVSAFSQGRADFVNRSSAPRELTTFKNVTYFSADDGIHGRELWRSDGTEAGTRMLVDTVPGPLGGEPEWFAVTSEKLYFAVTEPVQQQRKLWMSDGTAEGTGPVMHPPLDEVWLIRAPDSDGTRIYCMTERPGFTQIVKTDGSSAGTVVVDTEKQELSQFSAGQAHMDNFLRAPGEALFTVHGTDLYRVPDTSSVATLWGGYDHLKLLGVAGDTVLLTYRSAHGRELMALTDMQPAQLVREISSGPAPGIEVGTTDFATAGGLAYFVATDGKHGGELWRSDGTPEGTFMVKDINAGAASGQCGILTPAVSRLYFIADDGIHGYEPWVTDGTPEGTRLLRDVNPGPQASNPYRLCAEGDTLYFSATSEQWGEELWRSDGTEAGTGLVADIVPGRESSEPYYKSVLGDALLFSASDGQHGFELWATDGTAEGTRMVKDIAPTMGPNPSSSPRQLHAAGGLLYFTIRTATEGVELWCSDGTESGTRLVKDLYPGPPSANPGSFCALGDRLIFSAETPNYGIELWETRGSDVTTAMIADLILGPDSSSPTGMTAVGESRAVFAADNGVNGVELWITDGTARGTRMLFNIHEEGNAPDAKPESSFPREFARVGDQVFFTADDGEHGAELWVTDGTVGGTRIVRDIIPRHNYGANTTAK